MNTTIAYMSDTIAIVSRFSPQSIKSIDGSTIEVFAVLVELLTY